MSDDLNNLIDRIVEGTVKLLGIDDICDRLGISRQVFNQWQANGSGASLLPDENVIDTVIRHLDVADVTTTFPAPDIYIGGLPKWTSDTVKAWLYKNAAKR